MGAPILEAPRPILPPVEPGARPPGPSRWRILHLRERSSTDPAVIAKREKKAQEREERHNRGEQANYVGRKVRSEEVEKRNAAISERFRVKEGREASRTERVARKIGEAGAKMLVNGLDDALREPLRSVSRTISLRSAMQLDNVTYLTVDYAKAILQPTKEERETPGAWRKRIDEAAGEARQVSVTREKLREVAQKGITTNSLETALEKATVSPGGQEFIVEIGGILQPLFQEGNTPDSGQVRQKVEALFQRMGGESLAQSLDADTITEGLLIFAQEIRARGTDVTQDANVNRAVGEFLFGLQGSEQQWLGSRSDAYRSLNLLAKGELLVRATQLGRPALVAAVGLGLAVAPGPTLAIVGGTLLITQLHKLQMDRAMQRIDVARGLGNVRAAQEITRDMNMLQVIMASAGNAWNVDWEKASVADYARALITRVGVGVAVNEAFYFLGTLGHHGGGAVTPHAAVPVKHPEVAGCFVAGTKILMADGSSKNIEDVRAGDMALSYDEVAKEILAKKVLSIVSPVHTNLVQLAFSNGTVTTNTPNHRYFTKENGWASCDPELTQKEDGVVVKRLGINETVFVYENGKLTEARVISLTAVVKETQTYNLSNIEDTHTFFANGVLVHNVKTDTSQAGSSTESLSPKSGSANPFNPDITPPPSDIPGGGHWAWGIRDWIKSDGKGHYSLVISGYKDPRLPYTPNVMWKEVVGPDGKEHWYELKLHPGQNVLTQSGPDANSGVTLYMDGQQVQGATSADAANIFGASNNSLGTAFAEGVRGSTDFSPAGQHALSGFQFGYTTDAGVPQHLQQLGEVKGFAKSNANVVYSKYSSSSLTGNAITSGVSNITPPPVNTPPPATTPTNTPVPSPTTQPTVVPNPTSQPNPTVQPPVSTATPQELPTATNTPITSPPTVTPMQTPTVVPTTTAPPVAPSAGEAGPNILEETLGMYALWSTSGGFAGFAVGFLTPKSRKLLSAYNPKGHVKRALLTTLMNPGLPIGLAVGNFLRWAQTSRPSNGQRQQQRVPGSGGSQASSRNGGGPSIPPSGSSRSGAPGPSQGQSEGRPTGQERRQRASGSGMFEGNPFLNEAEAASSGAPQSVSPGFGPEAGSTYGGPDEEDFGSAESSAPFAPYPFEGFNMREGARLEQLPDVIREGIASVSDSDYERVPDEEFVNRVNGVFNDAINADFSTLSAQERDIALAAVRNLGGVFDENKSVAFINTRFRADTVATVLRSVGADRLAEEDEDYLGDVLTVYLLSRLAMRAALEKRQNAGRQGPFAPPDRPPAPQRLFEGFDMERALNAGEVPQGVENIIQSVPSSGESDAVLEGRITTLFTHAIADEITVASIDDVPVQVEVMSALKPMVQLIHKGTILTAEQIGNLTLEVARRYKLKQAQINRLHDIVTIYLIAMQNLDTRLKVRRAQRQS